MAGETRPNADWQRVSPLSIIFYFVTSALSFVRRQLLSAGPLFLAAFYISDNPTRVIVMGTGAMIGFFFLRSVVRYIVFGFCVLEDRLLIRQGIINRETLELHFNRIQNINISIPFYYVPFRLVNCRLDSAGSEGQEAIIAGTTQEIAEAIQRQVLAFQAARGVHFDVQEETSEEEVFGMGTPLMALTPIDAAMVGVINARVWALAAFIVAFLDRILNQFGLDMEDLIPTVSKVMPGLSNSDSPLFYAVLFLIVAVILFAASALRAFIQYYGFVLFEDGERLRKSSGLIEQNVVSLTKAKVQGVTVRQNLRAYFLRRVVVQFHQISRSTSSESAFVIPAVKKRKWQSFAQLAFPDMELEDKIKFQRIDRRFISRNFTIFILPLVLILTFLIATSDFGLELTLRQKLLPLALLIPGWIVCFQIWWRHGIWQNDDYMIVRRGFLTVKFTVFPVHKIQQLSASHTPMQQSKDLKNLGIHLTFSSVDIPWLPAREVDRFINKNLAFLESSKKSWL